MVNKILKPMRIPFLLLFECRSLHPQAPVRLQAPVIIGHKSDEKERNLNDSESLPNCKPGSTGNGN